MLLIPIYHGQLDYCYLASVYKEVCGCSGKKLKLLSGFGGNFIETSTIEFPCNPQRWTLMSLSMLFVVAFLFTSFGRTYNIRSVVTSPDTTLFTCCKVVLCYSGLQLLGWLNLRDSSAHLITFSSHKYTQINKHIVGHGGPQNWVFICVYFRIYIYMKYSKH